MRRTIAARSVALALALVSIVVPLAAAPRAAPPPRVEVSLKPVHALIAGVMEGIATPDLLVKGTSSPHGYALRPSEARRIAEAKLVFWVSEYLETFLVKPLSSLKSATKVIELIAIDGLTRFAARRGGAWQHDERDNGHDDPHGTTARAAVDPHIWLDPMNAKAIARAAARALAGVDPVNGPLYVANAERLAARLDALDGEIRALLAPVRGLAYAVFHDSYQYFERRYGLRAIGALSVSPERSPGAKRLMAIRARLRETGARCLFSEPQFEPALVHTVVTGIGVKAGVLDPLGADLAPGVDAYFALLRRLAQNLHACLTGGS